MLQLGPEYPGEHLHLLFTQIPPFRQSGWQVAEIGKKKKGKNNRIMNKTKKRDYSRNKSPNYVAEKQISNICINNKRNKQTNKNLRTTRKS